MLAVVVLPSPSPVPGRRVGRRVLRVLARVVVLVVIAVTALAAGYAGWADLRPVRIDVGVGGTRVTAAGVDTHVEAWPAEHPHGLPPLVLIPGFAESTYVWSRVAPLLARDRDVYAYDVRGYGTTDHLPPYTLAADADQLGGLLAALGLTGPRRPVVVGHSLGAAVALAQALREPASVVGVVLANGDGTPFGVGPGWVRSLLVDPFASAVVDVVVRHRGPVRTLVAGACGPGCPVDDAAVDRWRAPFLAEGGTEALVAVLRRPLIGLTYGQEEAVRVPTGVIASSEDETFDLSSARATAARLRTDRVAVLPGARHLALLGDPGAFAAALATVLR